MSNTAPLGGQGTWVDEKMQKVLEVDLFLVVQFPLDLCKKSLNNYGLQIKRLQIIDASSETCSEYG